MEKREEIGGDLRRRGRGSLGVTALVATAVAVLAVTGLGTAMADLSMHAPPSDPTYRCAGDGALVLKVAGPPAGSHPTHKDLALTWYTVDDEDSGFAGYWAMDTYSNTLDVWELSNGSFYWEHTYKGVFEVPQGAVSPGETGTTPNAVPEPAPGYGTFEGGDYGYIASTERFTPGSSATTGNLGTLNYGGTTSDILLGTYGAGQVGDAAPFNWYTAYFTPGSGADFYYGDSGNAWGFVYALNNAFATNPAGSSDSSNLWCNFGAGDFGDIVTAA
jgi:hypothetical protein